MSDRLTIAIVACETFLCAVVVLAAAHLEATTGHRPSSMYALAGTLAGSIATLAVPALRSNGNGKTGGGVS